MKIKNGFVVRKIGDRILAVAIGEVSREFHGMIKLNETAQFMWKQLEDEKTFDELLSAVLEAYDIDEQTARKDVIEFINVLDEGGILERA